MTYTDKFAPETGQDFGSNYPELFGITLTPKVGGLLAGIIGLAGASYLWFSMVQPAQQTQQELVTNRQQKQQQVSRINQEQIAAKIKALTAQKVEIRQQRQQILALFSDEETLDTLLLDLNRFISSRNAQLTNFKIEDSTPKVISDGSLGTLVNGKLKRQRIEINMTGDFEQTEAVLRDIERLQSLLLITQLNTQPKPGEIYLMRYDRGKLIPSNYPQLKTDLTIDVLLPLSRQELNTRSEQKTNQRK